MIGRLLALSCVVMDLLLAGPAFADALLIKAATVAPKGSLYHRVLQEVGEQWRTAQGDGARFVIYPNSSQGTEADTVRRLRVGQLQAAMLTVAGLKEIDAEVTALQKMPMMFRSWDELDYVTAKLRPTLEAHLREKGFVVLFWGEGGWVQFFSKTLLETPADFKQQRLFAWAGDNSQVDIMKSLGYRPVTLDVGDVLPALQTGMLDAAPLATMWSLVFQIDSIAPYMLRVNWVPIVGATVMTLDAWNRSSPAAQQALLASSARATQTLRDHRRSLDDDAARAMALRGLTITELTPATAEAWRRLAESAWPQIRGRIVPVETFDRVQALLAEYRRQQGAAAP